LDRATKAFDQREHGLAEYAEALEAAARGQSADLGAYPNLARFLEARKLEQSIALDQVKQEQAALIGRLSEVASEADLEDVVEKAAGMKEGRVTPLTFYSTLQRLAETWTIDLAGSPNLTAYLRYLTTSSQIDSTILATELPRAAAELRRGLSVSAESRELNQILEELDLVEKLLELGLSPDEQARLKTVDLGTIASRWERFVNAQRAQDGLPPASFEAVKVFQAQVPVLERFYQAAQERDGRLVQNALAKLRETGEPLAVLITGGFHAPEIGRLLKAAGVATVLVTPKVSAPTDERLYRAIVKYKSGHGSFEEVMALAGQ